MKFNLPDGKEVTFVSYNPMSHMAVVATVATGELLDVCGSEIPKQLRK